MTYEETREGNRLIMRFMGAVIQIRTNPVKYNVQFFHPYRKSKLCWTGYSATRKTAIKSSISLGGHYHTDWNYIIPAYKKLSEKLWLEKEESNREELIKFMNKAIADDNPQFAFETLVDSIKALVETISEAVKGNASVLYDNGWSAQLANKTLEEAISEIKWERGLTTLPPFTESDKRILTRYFTDGYNAAQKAIEQ